MYGEQTCALAGLVRSRRGSFTVCVSLILHARAHGRHRQSCTRRRAGPQRPRHERRSREGRGRERSCPDSACGIVVPKCQMLISFERKETSCLEQKHRATCARPRALYSPRPAATGNGPHCTILHAIFRSKCMRDVTEHVGTRVSLFELFLLLEWLFESLCSSCVV